MGLGRAQRQDRSRPTAPQSIGRWALPLCGLLSNLRATERAAASGNGYIAFAFRAFFLIGQGLLLESLHQRIHRQNHEVVDGQRDQQERDDGVHKIAVEELRAIHFKEEAREVWLLGDSSNRSEEHTSELQSLRHLVCRL